MHFIKRLYHANSRRLAVYGLMLAMFIISVVPAAAQTATPSIQVPTSQIFSETNSWISTFAPIAAIGIGITVALAVLGYIGNQIAKAFRG